MPEPRTALLVAATALWLLASSALGAAPPRQGVRVQGSPAVRGIPAGVVTGTPPAAFRVLVLPVSYSDLTLTFDRERIDALFNREGYSSGGASGSVRDYFSAQFGERTEFSFDVAEAVTLPDGYASYGANTPDGRDVAVPRMVADACVLADAQVDFSRYDALYVMYAGGSPADGSADDDHVWPGAWVLGDGRYMTLDGRELSAVAVGPELMLTGDGLTVLGGIGTPCHEISHLLGLPDLYDVDGEGSGGLDQGLWTTSVMSRGCYNHDAHVPPGYNAVEREMLGLSRPEPLSAGHYRLSPLGDGGRSLRIDGPDADEYYIIEARSAKGWDRYIGGGGLLVYHVDRSGRAAGYSTRHDRVLTACQRWQLNEVNARPDCLCCDLIEADPGAVDARDVFYPHVGADGSPAVPDLVFRDGSRSSYALHDIRMDGDDVLFEVSGPVSIDVADIYQDAAIFDWSAGPEDVTACRAVVTDGDRVVMDQQVPQYAPGLYSLTVEGLEADHGYVLCIEAQGSVGMSETRYAFVTRAFAGQAFICLGDGRRLPLRVYNTPGADYVTWTFDGERVAPGADGYYLRPGPGVLVAHVYYTGGDEEIIVKRFVQ